MKLQTTSVSTRGKYWVSNIFVFGILLKATDKIESYMQGRVRLRSERFPSYAMIAFTYVKTRRHPSSKICCGNIGTGGTVSTAMVAASNSEYLWHFSD